MNLIGINGFRGTGKDTAYSFIQEAYGPAARRRAFADKLKVMAALALGYEGAPEKLIADMNFLKEDGYVSSFLVRDTFPDQQRITGRRYLQLFGAKAREVFGDSFWVDQVVPLDWATGALLWENETAFNDTYLGEPTYACVTDVRYPNEAERILALGGVVWQIIRPGIESDGHSSEQPLPLHLVTTVIENNGSLDQYRDTVLGATAQLPRTITGDRILV